MPQLDGVRRPPRIDQRRRALRDDLWPDAAETIWSREHGEKGWTTMPRTLALVCGLTKDLTPKGDPGRTYLDLWTRTRDDGFVEVDDEQEFAASAGYAENSRNVRTWRGHMETLEALGFLRVKPKPTRKFGFILLVHPHDVVVRLRGAGRVNDRWWALFQARVHDTGTVLRGASGRAGADGGDGTGVSDGVGRPPSERRAAAEEFASDPGAGPDPRPDDAGHRGTPER